MNGPVITALSIPTTVLNCDAGSCDHEGIRDLYLALPTSQWHQPSPSSACRHRLITDDVDPVSSGLRYNAPLLFFAVCRGLVPTISILMLNKAKCLRPRPSPLNRGQNVALAPPLLLFWCWQPCTPWKMAQPSVTFWYDDRLCNMPRPIRLILFGPFHRRCSNHVVYHVVLFFVMLRAPYCLTIITDSYRCKTDELLKCREWTGWLGFGRFNWGSKPGAAQRSANRELVGRGWQDKASSRHGSTVGKNVGVTSWPVVIVTCPVPARARRSTIRLLCRLQLLNHSVRCFPVTDVMRIMTSHDIVVHYKLAKGN